MHRDGVGHTLFVQEGAPCQSTCCAAGCAPRQGRAFPSERRKQNVSTTTRKWLQVHEKWLAAVSRGTERQARRGPRTCIFKLERRVFMHRVARKRKLQNLEGTGSEDDVPVHSLALTILVSARSCRPWHGHEPGQHSRRENTAIGEYGLLAFRRCFPAGTGARQAFESMRLPGKV